MTHCDDNAAVIRRRFGRAVVTGGLAVRFGVLICVALVGVGTVLIGCGRDGTPDAEARRSRVAIAPATAPAATAATAPSVGIVDRGLVADYYTGDGLGYNIQLSLRADGTFSATWYGCVGNYGDASGNWVRAGDRVTFDNRASKGRLANHLRGAIIVKGDGFPALVLDQGRKFYDEHGLSRVSALQRATADER
jgi:hypothetical protein